MRIKIQPLTCYRTSMLFFVLVLSPVYGYSASPMLVGIALYQTPVKGIVKDSQGILPGVTLVNKRNNQTIQTDAQGQFYLDLNRGDTLLFSMLGYLEQTRVYQGETSLLIMLLEDTTTLNEIVVNAGYYKVKERERTGSIARITAKDLEFQPIINPLQAMQGRMAGVSITQNSGIAGGGFDVQIRGKNSLNPLGNFPLYLVDGIPFASDNLTQSTLSENILSGSSISPLNLINPNDIENIEVLKDADATAIYGSKGANGVVLITTKKGSSNHTTFMLSTSIAYNRVASKMKLMNTSQFNTMREEAFANDGITNYPPQAYDLNGTWDRYRYTDWQKELIGGTAIAQDTKLTILGGGLNTKFSTSISHAEQGNVFPTDKKFKRNTFNFTYNYKSSNQAFELNSSILYAQLTNDQVNMDPTDQALKLAPNAPSLYQADGSLNWSFGIMGNPLAPLLATYQYKSTNLVLNLGMTYALLPNLQFKLNTGITSNQFDELQLKPHTMYDPAYGYTSEHSSSAKAINTSKNFSIEPQFNYQTTLATDHSINFLVGATFQSNEKNNLEVLGSDFSSDVLLANLGSAKNIAIRNSGASVYNYAALFTRLNYTYNDTYILNLTARRDGSSRFGKNKKFGNFGALGAAWIFSNYAFLSHQSWLSFGKLRASYGITGSDAIGDYQYLDTYENGDYYYNQTPGLVPSRLYNPNFSWEETRKFEMALEFSLLNEQLQGSVAFYRNTSSNQLVGIPLPGTTGFTSIQANLHATVENKGWEFTLNTALIRSKNWQWNLNLNFSIPQNKLVSFPNLEGSTYAYTYVIGQSTSVQKFYNYLGIDPATGLYQFEGYQGENSLSALTDKTIMKNIGIQYHGGLTSTLRYRNLNLDLTFQYVKQYNFNYYSTLSIPGTINNQPVEFVDRWNEALPNASHTFYSTGANQTINELTNLLSQSTKAVSDASYLRLKNINLSYAISFPKAHVQSILFYFQGQNLWTLTNYLGLDPEFLSLGYLPPLKTYAFGIQITL